jgi:hypothetical protein
MLHNECYRGVFVYGRTQREDFRESSRKVRSEKVVRFESEALRIVPEDLWSAAHERLKTTKGSYLRRTNGRVWGRPEINTPSPYLLTGLSVCGVCGAALLVRTIQRGKYSYYACAGHHRKGDRVCANRLTMHGWTSGDGFSMPSRSSPGRSSGSSWASGSCSRPCPTSTGITSSVTPSTARG